MMPDDADMLLLYREVGADRWRFIIGYQRRQRKMRELIIT
jgi:hypothetical protein